MERLVAELEAMIEEGEEMLADFESKLAIIPLVVSRESDKLTTRS